MPDDSEPPAIEAEVADDATNQEEPISSGVQYRGAILLFWETMEALRDLAEAMRPVLLDLDGYERIGKDLAGQLPRDEQASFLEFWASQRAPQSSEDDGDDVGDQATAGGEGDPDKAEESEAQTDSDDWRGLVEELVASENPRSVIGLRMVERFLTRAPRSFFAYQSLLAMAVGAFEVLLGQTWSTLFRDRPAMLSDHDKRFSLADLAQFSSMDDAVEFAIEERVDALLFKSLVEWKDWFSKQEITDFSDYAIDWDRVQEVVQRRHIVVHNGGKVSRRYLDALPDGDDRPELGKRIWTGVSYLHDAIDELVVLGSIVAGSTWRKIHRAESDEIARTLLAEVAYPLLVSERWRAAAHMSNKTREIVSEGYVYWALQCNEWHARKMQFGLEEIRKEVEAWDTTAHAKVFVLVRLCLLEQTDAAFSVLEPLLKEGELDQEYLREWPILAPLRDDPRYLLLPDSKPDSADRASEEE